MNQVNLVGRITKDLEVRYTESKKAVCNFAIAVNRNYTGENGEREADFVSIQVWGKRAENLGKYQGKGSLVGINGELRVDQWEEEGQRKYKTYVLASEIEYLSSKTSEESEPEKEDDPFAKVNVKNIEIDDDDLPF